jgi:hypothetical protein
MFGRIAYVGRAWKAREMTFPESLDGLEAQIEGQCVALMKDYWKSKNCRAGSGEPLPFDCISSHLTGPPVREWLSHYDGDPAHVLLTIER